MTQTVGAAGGAPAAGDNGGAPSVSTAPWTDAIQDTELKDFAINKGYHKMKAEEALPVAVGQYRNLEKLIGAEKAGRTVELPNWDGTDEVAVNSQKAFLERIGVPKTASDYKLQIKVGETVDPALSESFAKLMQESGIPTRSASKLAEGYNAIRAQQDAAKKTADTAKYAEQDKALRAEWGSKYDDNMTLAKNAAKAFGVSAGQLDAAQNTSDYLTVMKMFTGLAAKIGEAQFIDGGQGNTSGKMTPAEAKAANKSFIADPEVRKGLMDKYHPKHAEFMARKAQLSAWEVGM